MDEKYTYLLVDFLCMAVPFLFSFHPKLKFYKEWKFLWLPGLVTAVFFVLWDCLFTHIGVWSFNEKYIVGVYFFNLPVEEILFFICIPYACTFSYYCFKRFFQFRRYKRIAFCVAILIASSLLIVSFFNLSRLYTSVTFILLWGVLIICVYKKPEFLAAFFFCYIFILIPFFISNGILTGSYFNRTVVMYNNEYNLGIRLLTIPLEDVFYGMLLLLMNIFGYELVKKRISFIGQDQKIIVR